MNVRNLVIFLSLVIPLVCYSSDNIHLNSGQIIEGKVLSSDTTTVTAEILKSGIKRTFYITEIHFLLMNIRYDFLIPHIREFISFSCEFKSLIMISEWNEKENNMLRYK